MLSKAVFFFALLGLVAAQRQSHPKNKLEQIDCFNDTYIADDHQCDLYYECKRGEASEQLCPEGLVFNNAKDWFPRYPCVYPQETNCTGRGKLQAPISNDQCPHLNAKFRGHTEFCGNFTVCIDGVAIEHECPQGLAFNEDTINCDRPELVPGCEHFMVEDFHCPGKRVEVDLGHVRTYDPASCTEFFICLENAKPLRQSCGMGYVFNEKTGACDDQINVPRCSHHYEESLMQAFRKLKSFNGGEALDAADRLVSEKRVQNAAEQRMQNAAEQRMKTAAEQRMRNAPEPEEHMEAEAEMEDEE